MKRTLLDKLGDFVLGKGFYIVLFLCVATIGISGYYMIRTLNNDPDPAMEPVTGNPTVILPDQSTPAQQGEQTPRDLEKMEQEKPKEQEAPKPSPVQEEKQTGGEASVPVVTERPAAPAVYTWPVKGEILRDFSVETLAYDQTMGDWRTHDGMDIAAEEGLKVLCISDGTVLQVRQDDLMGTTVSVDHGKGLVSVYANLAPDLAVEAGQEVDTGTVLGTVGNTAIGETELPSHLHLEMTLDGEHVDPTGYLPGNK